MSDKVIQKPERPDNTPRARRARRDIRVFRRGIEVAVDKVIPALETKYRLAAMERFWIAIAITATTSYIIGYVLGSL